CVAGAPTWWMLPVWTKVPGTDLRQMALLGRALANQTRTMFTSTETEAQSRVLRQYLAIMTSRQPQAVAKTSTIRLGMYISRALGKASVEPEFINIVESLDAITVEKFFQ